METLGQPLQQPWLCGGQIDTGHANLGESQAQAFVLQPRNQTIAIELSTTRHHAPIVESPALGPAATALLCTWQDEEATRQFAARLAAQPALGQAFLALHGDLGAGKTTFTRHLLAALGVTGRVKSPTYTVVEPYALEHLDIWHFDFYRFHDPLEWEDAGFRDIFASPGLKLAEWPEKAAGLLPTPDLDLYLTTLPDATRQVRLQAHTALGASLLQGLQA